MVLLKEVTNDPDAILVEECLRGDDSAFDEIVNRYKDRIFNVVYRFLGNYEDAQDVAQEVFVRAYQGMRGYKGRAKVYTWLHSIAGNLARNKLRDGQRKGRNKGTSLQALEESAPGVARQIGAAGPNPEYVARAHEMEEILQECLDTLPEQYRMAFVLRTFDQLSYEEIASAMGCPAGTVKSRLSQARLLLQRELRERSVI